MARRSNTLAASLTVALAALSGISCGSKDDTGGNATCTSLMSYTSTVTTQLSFATDIYPILSNTMAGTSTTPSGCAQTLICHGDPPLPLDDAMTKTLKFTDPPATVKAALLAKSVNAPSMNIVVPGSVQNSFIAYKISATVDKQTACGAPMPSNGTIAPADRTKILDWVASGASD
jgi:hypothetical protein